MEPDVFDAEVTLPAEPPAAPTTPEGRLAARDRFRDGPQHERSKRFAEWQDRRWREERAKGLSPLDALDIVQHEWLNDPKAPKP